MSSPNLPLIGAIVVTCWSASAFAVSPVVEIEEIIYSVQSAGNGAGPMWDYGSTNLVRIGEQVYVSGLVTLPDIPPLNNAQCNLWLRTSKTWELVQIDQSGLTREPCPLVVFPTRGKVLLSSNPTLNPFGKAGGGPASPTILAFSAGNPSQPPARFVPTWQRAETPPAFSEHSYRSFAADAARSELVLLQNIGESHAEWTFRDSNGAWASQGKLIWPWDAKYEKPKTKPIRVCYPNVAVHDRAVHFVGVSDVVEPNEIWRQFKLELTGKAWDYVFRRLLYTSTPNIVEQAFSPWLEIANREETAGRITPGDLWLAPDGSAHIVWEEAALDLRLREKFFPQEKQRWSMNYAVVRNGRVEIRRTLSATDEGIPGPIPHLPRFQVTPDGRLFVFFYVNGTDESGKPLSENRILEVRKDGSISHMSVVPLSPPLDNYMTATIRAGSLPSRTLDLLGTAPSQPNTIRYARVGLN